VTKSDAAHIGNKRCVQNCNQVLLDRFSDIRHVNRMWLSVTFKILTNGFSSCWTSKVTESQSKIEFTGRLFCSVLFLDTRERLLTSSRIPSFSHLSEGGGDEKCIKDSENRKEKITEEMEVSIKGQC
jgi:hypothetical protein